MKRALILVPLLVLLTASVAWAIDIQNVQPAMGPQNLFSLYVSDPLAFGQFALGMQANAAGGPLRFEYEDYDETLNVVDSLSAAQFYGAVGLFEVMDLMAGGSYNMVAGQDLDSFRISGLSETEDESGTALGDAFAGAKIRFLHNEPRSVGLGLVVLGSFATGDPDYYVGADATNLSVALILDKRVSLVNFVMNVGYRYMGQPEDLEPAGQVFGGFGVHAAIAKWFGLTGEFVGKTVDYQIDGIEAGAPLEALAGARFYTPVGINFHLAGGLGITTAIGSPTYRVIAGVSFSYPKLRHGPPPPPATLPLPPVAPAPPLPPSPPPDTYTDPEGVSHPVIVRRPSGVLMLRDWFVLPRPVSFASAQSAVLTIDDQAMLDELAAILQQYPKVKIQIESHVATDIADAQKLTQARADAVLAYLYQRGVDASRMVAIGMGSDVPVAPNGTPEGRARNTRIDVLITEQ